MSSKRIPDQYYFNCKQAAAFCGKAPITLHKALALYRNTQGREGLPHKRKGHKTIQIIRPDLIAWMENGAEEPFLLESDLG